MASKKAPLERMEPLARAQIKEFVESKLLTGDFKLRLIDWAAGLHAALTSFDQVVDPDNPPEAGTVHDLFIREGKKKRLLQNLLLGASEAAPAAEVPEATISVDTNGQGQTQAPVVTAPSVAPVAPVATTPPVVAPPVAAPATAAALGM